jgi:hypothetical protein
MRRCKAKEVEKEVLTTSSVPATSNCCAFSAPERDTDSGGKISLFSVLKDAASSTYKLQAGVGNSRGLETNRIRRVVSGRGSWERGEGGSNEWCESCSLNQQRVEPPEGREERRLVHKAYQMLELLHSHHLHHASVIGLQQIELEHDDCKLLEIHVLVRDLQKEQNAMSWRACDEVKK